MVKVKRKQNRLERFIASPQRIKSKSIGTRVRQETDFQRRILARAGIPTFKRPVRSKPTDQAMSERLFLEREVDRMFPETNEKMFPDETR